MIQCLVNGWFQRRDETRRSPCTEQWSIRCTPGMLFYSYCTILVTLAKGTRINWNCWPVAVASVQTLYTSDGGWIMSSSCMPRRQRASLRTNNAIESVDWKQWFGAKTNGYATCVQHTIDDTERQRQIYTQWPCIAWQQCNLTALRIRLCRRHQEINRTVHGSIKREQRCLPSIVDAKQSLHGNKNRRAKATAAASSREQQESQFCQDLVLSENVSTCAEI